MVFLWFSYGFPMVFLWFSYGFPMVFLWFSYGFPMVFLWFSYGFPMVLIIDPPLSPSAPGFLEPEKWPAPAGSSPRPPGASSARGGPCSSPQKNGDLNRISMVNDGETMGFPWLMMVNDG